MSINEKLKGPNGPLGPEGRVDQLRHTTLNLPMQCRTANLQRLVYMLKSELSQLHGGQWGARIDHLTPMVIVFPLPSSNHQSHQMPDLSNDL